MRFRRKKQKTSCGPQIIDVNNLLRDTTRTERFQVFEVSASTRRYLAVLLVICGSLSTILSTQLILGAQQSLLIFLVITFICITNIVGGLLLLSSE
jgi:hypothetical protein